MDQAKNFVSNEVSRRASAAGQQVNSSADHLRTIADQLRSDDIGRPAAVYVDRGAATLAQVGRYLSETDGDQLLADAERFGRERPWAVAAAGFLAGLSASRMFKAAAAQRAGGYSAATPRSSDTPLSMATAPSAGRSSTSGTAPSGTGVSGSYKSAATPGGTPISSDAAPLEARSNASSTSR